MVSDPTEINHPAHVNSLAMSSPPRRPKVYHITHVDNLPKIFEQGVLWSDAKRLELDLDTRIVGMSDIKRRRLEELEVPCHPGTKVGEYVPFYFCPRSVMLYILFRGNHPELTYRDGQAEMVHLMADLREILDWAQEQGTRWAVTDRNAGAFLAQFFSRWSDLDKLNWAAIEATDFTDHVVKEGKQAEFLMHESFPCHLVEVIGVSSAKLKRNVELMLHGSGYLPEVRVERMWYY